MKQRKQKASTGGRPRIAVVPSSGGWSIAGHPAAIERRPYKTQREAVEAARKFIKTQVGGELTVHGRDGRVRSVDTYALGQEAFARISAVEGIVVTKEMHRDFKRLDRQGLSAAERRQWLAGKYGK
jgi:hypothetical protein